MPRDTDYQSIRPGQLWLDTDGKRINAHGGSLLEHEGAFYWYGENKERTTPGSGIWHWGVRLYRSTDLYNWDDLGVIILPVEGDPTSPLHPSQCMDRPHIVRNRAERWVCWLKIITQWGTQESTVLIADDLMGPWTIVRTGLRPLGMNAGDFDLVIDPHDGKGYYYFERVHSELICADLTDDLTNVIGYYSTHFPLDRPPAVREAPAHFFRHGLHYLITSGTTGYLPNPSQVAVAPTYHGQWTVLGDPHPADASRTSYCSQVSSVFRHPHKRDLYIALADRWLPGLLASPHLATGEFSADIQSAFASYKPGAEPALPPSFTPEIRKVIKDENTSVADYVWLPLRFEGDMALLEWRDEWHIENFD
jgi:hypothetical protein